MNFIKIMRTSRDPFDESTTIVNYKVTKHKIPLVPMPLLAEVALLTDRLVLGQGLGLFIKARQDSNPAL